MKLDNQGTTMDSSPGVVAVDEAETDVDTIYYWRFDRQMYLARAECPVLVAVGRGRTLRVQSECQICKSQPDPTVTVTSGGSKFHRRDCRAVGRCKTLD